MNHEWLFLPMQDSSDLLGDADALRTRLDDDGYLYLRGAIDREAVSDLRRAMLGTLERHGWIRGGLALMEGQAVLQGVHEEMPEYAPVYDDLQRLEAFHSFAHRADILEIMGTVLGPTAFPHPLKICRIGFPEHYEATTPPHQDYPNNQGTPKLTAAWIPVGDVPMDLGPVAILRGSHRYGMLPLGGHMGPGRRQAKVPRKMLEELRWVTTDFAAGDVLVFTSMTVHAALHNITEFNLRLSVDFRYQLEGEALTEICLHPHFQRVDWDEVYAGWSSDRYQYYWKDLDYELVPFDDYPVDRGSRADEDEYGFTPEEWVEIMTVDRRWESRHRRRVERLSEVVDSDTVDTDSVIPDSVDR
jgi:ectoine hydroxylase-related dioxygenase (phytanoyl-CoA dioxygenase family)